MSVSGSSSETWYNPINNNNDDDDDGDGDDDNTNNNNNVSFYLFPENRSYTLESI
jgi:hypothetical protein